MSIQRFAARISYQGTDYCGWQRQSGSASEGPPSIGGVLEAALHQISGEKPALVGSGRTDSGVHAAGQIAHFKLEGKTWDAGILLKAWNAVLPAAIRILALRSVPETFHAQRSAVSKQYSYYFQQGPCALPHLEPFTWWIRKRLNRGAMHEALQALVGEHDYKAFQASGAKTGPTVRRILDADVTWQPLDFPGGQTAWDPAEWGLIRVRVRGTGFLKQMVRGIAGTLLQIGEGRRPAADMGRVLASQDRTSVGATAPGRGLWLERVWYGEGLEI